MGLQGPRTNGFFFKGGEANVSHRNRGGGVSHTSTFGSGNLLLGCQRRDEVLEQPLSFSCPQEIIRTGICGRCNCAKCPE